jgi:ABC-type amino acid transport substrate-binding protein
MYLVLFLSVRGRLFPTARGRNKMWPSFEQPARLFRRTLRLGVILFLSVAAAVPAATKRAVTQATTLHLVSTPWSPFTNVPGKARFALDLVHSALERLGIRSDTTIVEEGRLTPSLLSGEFDGSAALWRDAARERALIYSQPYLENRLILVGALGSDVSAKRLDELAGKRLALVEGYAYGDAVKSPNGPTYVPSLSEEDSLQKLLSGSVDYTLMDQLVVEYLLKNHPAEARSRLVFGTAPLVVRTLHFAVRRTLPDAQRIIDLFNAQMLSMVADRSYHRLLQLDWIEADVDGDGRAEYVPRDDQPGPNPPDRSYKLFMERVESDPASGPRFYLGGKVYPTWSSVPEGYKATRPPGTFSEGAQFTIFSFEF